MIREHEHLVAQLKGTCKIVINSCFGGFGLSHEAVLRYLDLIGKPVWPEKDPKFGGLVGYTYYTVPPEERVEPAENWHEMTQAERIAHNAAYSRSVFHYRDVPRDDPYLVQVIEELGERANGRHAKLKIVEIPANVDWIIDEYDGNETIAEQHRTWS